MRETLNLLTGMTDRQRSDALAWLSRQAEEVRVEVMMGRFRAFHKLKKAHDQPAPTLDYAALLIAIGNNGWRAERRYRSSAVQTARELKGISRRRVVHAKERTARRARLRETLAVHWGEVVELRNADVSFRGIAEHFGRAHNLTVSHTTIHKLWKKWKCKGGLPL